MTTTTATVKAKAPTHINIKAAIKRVIVDVPNRFLTRLYVQEFTVTQTSPNELQLQNQATGDIFLAMFAGNKLVIIADENSKASVSIGLNRQVALTEFLNNHNGYVVDLAEHTVKAVVVSSGWKPSEDVEQHLTVEAIMALSNTVIASSKGSSGEIEHFVFSGEAGYAAKGIVEVREALTTVVNENGGFVVVEKETKSRKPRTASAEKAE